MALKRKTELDQKVLQKRNDYKKEYGSRLDVYNNIHGYDLFLKSVVEYKDVPKDLIFENLDVFNFVKYFNLKGVEFGNWVNQESRTNYLYATFVSLFHLCKILDIDPKLIGLQEKVSIAFGARGAGRALAHFEPLTNVINLTRYYREDSEKQSGGIGSLGHEYGHALDYIGANLWNYSSLTAGRSTVNVPFVTEKDDETPTQQDLIPLYKMERILMRIFYDKHEYFNDAENVFSKYYEKIRKISEDSNSDYLYRRNELFARAFEVFLHIIMKDRNIKDGFLKKFKYDSVIYIDEPTFRKKELIGLIFDLVLDIYEKIKGASLKGKPDARNDIWRKKAQNLKGVPSNALPKNVVCKDGTEKTRRRGVCRKRGGIDWEQSLVSNHAGKSGKNCFANYFPVDKIFTDEKRFQNRDAKFSQESVNRIIEFFNENLIDPIVIWTDEKNNKTYVLSGHSRLEAFKQMNKKNIPARFFIGTEADAIKFARIDANRGGTPETITEDIRAFKMERDGTNGMKQLNQTQLKKKWGKKYELLENLSYLNPKGEFITSLMSAEMRETAPKLEAFAKWTGGLRKHYSVMDDRNETEIFDFLYSNPYKNYSLTRDDFEDFIESKVGVFFEKGNMLNLEGNKPTGLEARKDTATGIKRLQEIQREIKRKSREIKSGTYSKEATDAMIKEVQLLLAEKEKVEKAVNLNVRTQQSMFGKTFESKLKYKHPHLYEYYEQVEKLDKEIKHIEKELNKNVWSIQAKQCMKEDLKKMYSDRTKVLDIIEKTEKVSQTLFGKNTRKEKVRK